MAKPNPKLTSKIADLALDEAILAVLADHGAGTLSPPEIAQMITPQGDWHALLTPIRRAAVTLASDNRLVIYRKGKPVDPRDFRGVYRLGLPGPTDSAPDETTPPAVAPDESAPE
jgi:hypothetical protein